MAGPLAAVTDYWEVALDLAQSVGVEENGC